MRWSNIVLIRNTCFSLLIGLGGLCVINIYYMHQFFALNGYMESELFLYSIPVNIFITFFDFFLLFLLFSFISALRLKFALSLSYIATFLLSFVNVFYGRFFSQYLPFSAIEQITSLGDGIVVDSMLAGFLWSDLYYLISPLIAVYIMIRCRSYEYKMTLRHIILIIIVQISSLLGVFCSYSTYHLCNSTCRNNYELFKNRQKEILFNPLERKDALPNITRYHAGLIRPFVSDLIDYILPYRLSYEQSNLLEKEYNNHNIRKTTNQSNPQIKNVVFILLESFLSASSDLIVDNKRITPFLDSLKHSDDVYYNGNVHSNISIGESGDGQLIYMTGLLPLRTKISVGEAKKDTLPGLPSLLKSKYHILRTEIVIPSNPGLWQQESMNKVYGIDYCYSQNDVEGEQMRDDVVFKLARNTLKNVNESFFSMVLSFSTHQPYRKFIDETFKLRCDTLPQPYLVYLNACHFLDKQIRLYFDDLKAKDIYNNSLIVIASDHQPHMEMLGMHGRISDNLPLFIIHGNINNNAYIGECNQLDVYTTILDVLNINNNWLGLGNTLLNPLYINSVSEKKYEMSEWIIRGNYFRYLNRTNK